MTLLRRHVLGRRQRGAAQARARRHRRDRVPAAAGEIRRYIQDRTVIEDTESTIDLAIHGWSLLNYPERLSYSATPPDFGSLCIQRRRWANGGLLILPKLWRSVRASAPARRARTSFGETAAAGQLHGLDLLEPLGLVVPAGLPVRQRAAQPAASAVAALPYFLAMASDLQYCGYKRTDVLRIYGFNLILLPVNLAGVLNRWSRRSPATRARSPARRRSATGPAGFMFVVLAVPDRRVLGLHLPARLRTPPLGQRRLRRDQRGPRDLRDRRVHRRPDSLVDIWANVLSWLYKPQGPKKMAARAPAALEPTDDGVANWELVLYLGHVDRRRRPRDVPETPSELDRAPLTLPVTAPEVDPDRARHRALLRPPRHVARGRRSAR